MSDLLTRLRILRAERHITQQDVASGTNMSLKGYNAVENGRAAPSMQTLMLLADYFEVSLDYLTGRSDNRER